MSLSACFTVGAIPANIGKMSNLAALYLNENKLTGTYRCVRIVVLQLLISILR